MSNELEAIQKEFEQIVRPFSKETFIEQVLEKKVFVGKGNIRELIRDLPSVNFFTEFIKNCDLRFPTIHLVRQGQPVNYRDYTEIVNSKGVIVNYVKKQVLNDYFQNGATVVINNIHLFHPAT